MNDRGAGRYRDAGGTRDRSSVGGGGGCGESSGAGGEWTIEDLAEWCSTDLSTGAREGFAETLYAIAKQAGETQDAADRAELPYLITAE